MKIAIIPARGGSRRIPNKNIREFHGKPIIAYSIELAHQCGLFDRVIVSTDSPDIEDVSRSYGAEIHQRPAYWCDDRVGTQEVARGMLQGVIAGWAWNDLACVLYATAPLLDVTDVIKAGDLLHQDEDTDIEYVFGVNRVPLFDAGQFYWGRLGAFLTAQPLISQHSRMWPLPPNRVCDINEEADWVRAEQMYTALQTQGETNA